MATGRLRGSTRPGGLALLGLLAGMATACAGGRSGEPPLRATGPADPYLWTLYERGDFFGLRAALDSVWDPVTPTVLLVRAATTQAFNDTAGANRELTGLARRRDQLSPSFLLELDRLRFRADMRAYEYAAAANDAREFLALSPPDSAMRADVENDARIAQVLRDVPPQRVLRRAATELRLSANGRVPLQVGDSLRAYLLDTGASFSVMTRSEAAALGLVVRPAGVAVGTSTGTRVRADVAVAPRVRVGMIELSDVVFLVLPDQALTFGPSLHIPGLIGFPVAAALGELEFRRDGLLRIPARVPARTGGNLALRNFTPLARITIEGQPATCELDTGAGETVLLDPFYERFRRRIEKLGHPETVRTLGAGGSRAIGSFVLRDMELVVGRTRLTLPRLRVFTQSVAIDPTQLSDCRLGQDVLRSFPGYIINFRSMNLLPS